MFRLECKNTLLNGRNVSLSSSVVDMRRECLWCGVTDCRDSCEQCGLFYCSPNHRSLHLSDGGGGGDCCPFRIEERPGKGRCMIATKDIKPQELIVRDTPLVIGPSRQTEGVSCTACYASMTGEKLKRCLKCNFPLCGLCGKEKLRWHEQFECRNLVCEVPDNNRGLLCEQISSLLLYRFILRSRLGELPVMFACPGEITLSPDDLNTLRFFERENRGLRQGGNRIRSSDPLQQRQIVGMRRRFRRRHRIIREILDGQSFVRRQCQVFSFLRRLHLGVEGRGSHSRRRGDHH